jgi:putative transcriptional regulator
MISDFAILFSGIECVDRVGALLGISGDNAVKPQQLNGRKFDLNVQPIAFSPEMVKATRHAIGVSQSLFAKFLGVSVRTVRAWEQEISPPSDMACRFLDEIRRNPKHWKKRLKEVIVSK